MRPLIEAELIKLRSTRLLWAVVGITLVLASLGTAIPILGGSLDGKVGPQLAESQRNLLANGAGAGLFLFILGLSGITSEFRFGTITPTLLTAPERGRVLLGKALTFGGIALTLTAATVAVCHLIGLPLMVMKDIPIELETSDHAAVILGGVGSAVLMTLFGLGLGAAVRSTVAVLIGMIALLIVVLPLLATVSDEASRWLPLDTAARAAGVVAEGPSQVLSVLILTGYTALALGAGAFLLERRDVS